MILVVTPNQLAEESAEALRRATSEEVIVSESLREAAALLRTQSYLAVVLDQYLVETDPEGTETAMRHLGTAIPLQVNLAINGVPRLGREIRGALQRRQRDVETARRAVVTTLQSELNGTVTALLLSCELALGEPGLPLTAAENIEAAHDLVKKLRAQMESTLAVR